MPVQSSKPWFAAKRYGLGSGLPVAWQGWVTLLLFFGALLFVSMLPLFVHSAIVALGRILIVPVILAVFLLVCAAKTEGGWKWRWGEDP